jgi:hypothetical protein
VVIMRPFFLLFYLLFTCVLYGAIMYVCTSNLGVSVVYFIGCLVGTINTWFYIRK